MAHKSLPLGAPVRVSQLPTNKRVVARVHDRGPTTGDHLGDGPLVGL